VRRARTWIRRPGQRGNRPGHRAGRASRPRRPAAGGPRRSPRSSTRSSSSPAAASPTARSPTGCTCRPAPSPPACTGRIRSSASPAGTSCATSSTRRARPPAP